MKMNPTRPGAPLALTFLLVSLVASAPGAEPANPDSKPLTDTSGKANAESQRVRDNAKAAGTDVSKVDDSNPQKASPDARPSRDSSKMADPDATKLTDTTDDKASPYSRETSTKERLRNADPSTGELPDPAASETDAEIAVRKAEEDAWTAAKARKVVLQGQGDAGALIEEILGRESQLSRAELTRAGQSEGRRVIREDRSLAVDFLKNRLRGEADLSEAPPFFRRSTSPESIDEGRRFLHFDSSDDIPAILLANAKLERLKVQTAEEAGLQEGMPHPPKEYRGTEARFVSYSVQLGSMISSQDFRFNKGSTQFSDGHSNDMAFALADALKDPDLAGSRFIVEAHVAGEGAPEEHRDLAQSRAETVARELVRSGVSPLNLIPVGFGESETGTPANEQISGRGGDTRIVIARMMESSLPDVPAK